MVELSDEVLMAFADGNLPADERLQVAAIVGDRPDYAAKVRKFQETQAALHQALGTLDQNVPAEWVEQIRRTPNGAAPAMVTDLAGVRAARAGAKPKAPARAASWLPLAMAASVGLVIGALAGWGAKPRGSSSGDGVEIAAVGTVRSVLESGASGKAVEISGAGGATVMPVRTFKISDDHFCRQYEINRGDVSVVEGIACRVGASGSWDIRYHAEKSATSSGKMVPAGEKAKPIDDLVKRLGGTHDLDAGEEARVMRGGWK